MIVANTTEPAAVTTETVDRGDTEGIGDLTLFGQYRFYGQDNGGLQASFLSGIKTPTGETGERMIRASCLKQSSNPALVLGIPWSGWL